MHYARIMIAIAALVVLVLSVSAHPILNDRKVDPHGLNNDAIWETVHLDDIKKDHDYVTLNKPFEPVNLPYEPSRLQKLSYVLGKRWDGTKTTIATKLSDYYGRFPASWEKAAAPVTQRWNKAFGPLIDRWGRLIQPLPNKLSAPFTDRFAAVKARWSNLREKPAYSAPVFSVDHETNPSTALRYGEGALGHLKDVVSKVHAL